MSTHTVPTTAPEPPDAERVIDAPCPPLDHPTPGRVTDGDRAYVYARDAMTCQECGDGPLPTYGSKVADPLTGRHVVTRRYATLDHITPRLVGGCHHPHNLRVLCQTCNPRRGHDR